MHKVFKFRWYKIVLFSNMVMMGSRERYQKNTARMLFNVVIDNYVFFSSTFSNKETKSFNVAWNVLGTIIARIVIVFYL